MLSRLDLMSSYKEIVMRWIPSHAGVRRNERADSAAKAALNLKPDNIRISYTDLKPKINKLFFRKMASNAGITTSRSNSSKSSPLWENGDQLLENQERNKSLYFDCVLATQNSLTLSYSSKNSHRMFSWNVEPLLMLESDI